MDAKSYKEKNKSLKVEADFLTNKIQHLEGFTGEVSKARGMKS